MTSDHRPDWKNIIIVDGVLTVLLFAILLWFFGAPGAILLSAGQRVLLVAGIGAACFGLFARYGWTSSLARHWFGAPPDLRGRWKGVSKSSFDGQQREMVLEIRQTLLWVTCRAYGPLPNIAEGYSCRILSDRDNQVFKLAYLYHARSLDVSTAKQGDEHDGVAILDLNESATPRQLNGMYFNTREPVARGASVALSWESETLKGQF